MNTNKKTPKLRFKGFSDDWEQCKLGDLAEIVRGASPRPISDPKWFDNDSNVGWLRIADVTAQDGRIRYLEQKISELGQEKTRVIKTPHLLLSIAATVGKPVINYVPTGVHDGFLIFLNPKFNILYAFWWLEMFREKWNKYGQPGSQVNLNSDLVKNQVINIPNEKEQEKISSFLESLDKIITLHQCKLEKLKLTKKALLQKLFPKNGKRIPEIRFKGFTDAWEQRNLESLFTKYEDKVKTPNSGYWRLGLRSHCKGTFHTYVDAGNELETAEMNRVQSGNFILNITFAWERALAVTNEEDQDKLVSHRFPQFKPNSDLAIDFFKHTLIDKRFKHHLELSSPGGAGRNKVLKIADMLKYELLVPSIKEQNEISSFLNNVDYIITLYQRKLDRLISIKKALLQQLFV